MCDSPPIHHSTTPILLLSIIVDAYNYIGRSRELTLGDSKSSDTLIVLLGKYCGRVKKKLTLVFDGSYFPHLVNRKRQYGRVTVIYTSPIYTADDAIKKMIKHQESRRRKSLLVVTSDEDILEYARSHGTRVAKSEEFERQIMRTLAQKKSFDRVNIQISEQEVQEWLTIFGPESSEDPQKPPGQHIPPSSRKAAKNSPQARQEGQKGPQKKTPRKKKRKKIRRSSPPADAPIDRVNIHLSSREVDEWLHIFGARDEDEDEDE